MSGASSFPSRGFYRSKRKSGGACASAFHKFTFCAFSCTITGQGYAEDACPHADVAVVADLRRRQSAGASGGNLRRLGVIAGLAGAGLLSGLPGRRFLGDDPVAEGVGFLGSNDIAAARPFLLVAGVGNRPFLCAGVVRGILFAIFAAAVLTVRLLTQDVVLPEQLTVSLRVSSHLQTRV